MSNALRESLTRGEFVYTAELVMGRDHQVPDAETFVREAAQDPNGIRIISATDLPGGSPALPPEAFVAFVLENKLTPIAHLTGKDGNRGWLEARLHTFARMGVENILALTGDAHKPAFSGQPKPVFDLDSALILRLIDTVRGGIEYSAGPRTVKTTPFNFFAGAAVNPFKVGEAAQMMQLYKLELKIACGAQYIITQLGYDLRKLYEVKQYMDREGMGHIPVLANVYVATATIAKIMKEGEVAGCTIPDALIARLEGEKKPQRLERAALMVAAARDLGFAGAHIGGFGLTHKDFMAIISRSKELAGEWKKRIEELIFAYPGQFYLLPQGADGLSDGKAPYNAPGPKPAQTFTQRTSEAVFKRLIDEGSMGGRFMKQRVTARAAEGQPAQPKRHGLWHALLSVSNGYRTRTLGCVMCGDCIQDHLNYPGCTMRYCYKETRNGPCGGSRVNGRCEFNAEQECMWNLVYRNTLAAGKDPREEFARMLVPPRDWSLNRTSAMANRLVGIDNSARRLKIRVKAPSAAAPAAPPPVPAQAPDAPPAPPAEAKKG